MSLSIDIRPNVYADQQDEPATALTAPAHDQHLAKRADMEIVQHESSESQDLSIHAAIQLFDAPSLNDFNTELDAALDLRVCAHTDRLAKPPRISAETYAAMLKTARDVEYRIEPQRRNLGAHHSRAYTLCVRDGEIPEHHHNQ